MKDIYEFGNISIQTNIPLRALVASMVFAVITIGIFLIVITKIRKNEAISKLKNEKIDEKNLLDLSKELTIIKTNTTSYVHNDDMSWDDFYAHIVNLQNYVLQ